MRRQGAAVQGGLAAAALVAAYATWQRAPETPAGDVEVLGLARGDLQKVRYEDATHWVELTAGKGEQEPKVWVRTASRPEPSTASALDGGRVPDAGTLPDGGHLPVKPAAPVEPERELRGNTNAERDWESFAPLRATRALGKLGAAKLQELGLDASPRRLTVWGHGTQATFTVSPSLGGLGSAYVRSDANGMVYLLGGGALADLDKAGARLVERQLHAFRADEVTGFHVTSGGTTRSFTVRPGPGGASVVSPRGSETPDAFARNWQEKLFRLWPMEVLGRGEIPAPGAPQVGFRVEYLAGSRPLGFLEVGRAGHDFFGRSEGTAGWVRLPPSTEDLMTEAKKVVSALP